MELRINNGSICLVVLLLSFVFLASAMEDSGDLVNESLVIDGYDETLQYQAVIGRPVKWIKKVSGNDRSVGAKLPKGSEGIAVLVDEEIASAEKKISEYSIVVKKIDREDIVGGKALSGDVVLNFGENRGFLTRVLDFVFGFRLSGNVILAEDMENSIIEGEDAVVVEVDEVVLAESEVAIEYYTEAPVANETKLPNGKRIIVSAPSYLKYKDILAYTDVEGMGLKMNDSNSKLYWYMNEAEESLYFTEEEMKEIKKMVEGGVKEEIKWTKEEAKEDAKEIREEEKEIRKSSRSSEKEEKEEFEDDEKNETEVEKEEKEELEDDEKNETEVEDEEKEEKVDKVEKVDKEDEEMIAAEEEFAVSPLTGQAVLEDLDIDEEVDSLEAEVEEMMDPDNNPEGERVEVDFVPYDFDDDGYADYIEWIVPHLSAQVYDLEIVAVDAVHFDVEGVLISNIFEDIAATDDVWSEAVYEGESVRVWFESDLTDGRVIDVYVRSNGTMAYFDIYEASSGKHVGKSGITGGEELQYMVVSNLTEPTSVFDFVVRKPVRDEVDNSSSVDSDVVSFLEFDYIHDDYITPTQADGLLVYQEFKTSSPRYRTWDESNTFSDELIDAMDVGAGISWAVVKGNHERDEMIVGTLDKDNDVNLQVYDGSWGNLLEVSSNVPNAAYRSFDVEYEQVSGEALAVYEGSFSEDAILYYSTWNGYSYSAKQSFSLDSLANTVNWVSLTSKPGSDEMMLLVHDSSSNLFAVPWNGDSFDLSRQTVLTTFSSSATEEHFAFEWEAGSGDGLAVYSEGTTLVWEIYSSDSGVWGEGGFEDLALNGLDAVRLCSDITSDYIGIIFQNSGNDVSARMWDGTQILSGSPAEHNSTEMHGLNGANVDCAWGSSGEAALFGFVDRNSLSMDYFNFTKVGNVWGVSDLMNTPTTENYGADDIKTVRFSEHPTTGEIMILFTDLLETISVVRWTGSGFSNIAASPVEVFSEVLNGDQEGVMFDWYRYDPTPFVDAPELTYGEEYTALSLVELTVEVTDNIEVDSVWVTVILPDESIEDYVLADEDEDGFYNFTFSNTVLAGYYEIEIFANDTSSYQNINEEEVAEFTVHEVDVPAVSPLLPFPNSAYNVSNVIEIAADVIDESSMGDVFANVSYPNGTVYQVVLGSSEGDTYSGYFTVPGLIGDYDIIYVVGDEFDNVNSSESSTFSVSDFEAPVLLEPGCSPAILNLEESVVCSVSVVDDVELSEVFADLVYPNGTIVYVVSSNVEDSYYFNFSGTDVLGQYNMTWFANDTSGNAETEVDSFVVEDSIAPAVFSVVPAMDSIYNVSNVIEIAADITDAQDVNFVFASVTYPNETVFEIVLNLWSGDKYNASFVAPALVGGYDVNYVANDSSGNVNSSVVSSFDVEDVVAPVVSDLGCSPGVLNVSQVVICNASVSDDVEVEVDGVFAEITYPNGTVLDGEVNNVGDNYYFSFSDTYNIGQFDIEWGANDFSDNEGFVSSSFVVNDVVNPDVDFLFPLPGSDYEALADIEIAANVGDDVELSEVFANVSYPNGTIVSVVLNYSSEDKYNITFVAPALVGNYNITYVANDSSGNVNSSVVSNFNVSDSIRPDVSVLFPEMGKVFFQDSNITISADIFDVVGVYVAHADVVLPNTTVVRVEMLDLDLDGVFNVSFNVTTGVGGYYFTVYANDSSGNFNNSESGNFTILDTNKPLGVLVSPSSGSSLNYSNVNFTCSATDSGGLVNMTFYSNIAQPFGAYEARNVSGLSNQSSFIVNGVSDGSYIWNCLIGDIGGNLVFAGADYSFKVDTLSPNVSVVSPLGEAYNISNVIEISSNVSDSNTIETVFANVTYPNGTVFRVNMSYDVGDKYSGLFAVPGLLGSYNVTYVAVDFIDNVNSSVVSNFSVNDVNGPSVIDLGCTPGNLNLTQTVTCNAEVNDDLVIENVFANVTYPNGTSVSLGVFNVSNYYYFSFSGTDDIGEFNVSWSSSDSSGNLGANISSFFVSDVSAPSFDFLLPLMNAEYNISNVIELAADVTDAIAVDYVFANVTYPNETVVEFVLNYSSGDKYNASFVAPVLIGDYDVVYVANDSSGNVGVSGINSFSVADVVAPTLGSLLPVENSSYNVLDVFEVAVDVTDAIAVSYVFANISYPNGTVFELALNPFVGDKYNASFVAPGLVGNYNVTFVANDSSGNVDRDSFSNFSVRDIINPAAISLGCSPGILNVSREVVCNVFASDDVGIDFVFANVTYPNGTVAYLPMYVESSYYSFNFSGTTNIGQTNVLFVVNDFSGNSDSDTSSFFVNDVVGPVVNLTYPVYDYNLSYLFNSVSDFNFSAVDDSGGAVNCSLFIDGVPNATGLSFASGDFALSGFGEYSVGVHNWSVQCLDISGNVGVSQVWNFTMDDDSPVFVSLMTSPNSADGLDPNKNITVFAEVTDNSSVVDSVILQYKLSDASSYSSIGMDFDNESGYYIAVLNVDDAGDYNLRLLANDSVANSGFSDVVNKTLDLEYSWITSPASSFTPINAELSDDVSFGDMVVNNTGDYNLDFTIVSDSAETVYSDVETFTLAAGVAKILVVNDSATSAGIKTVSFEISATDSGRDYGSKIISAAIVVAPGQPILVSRFLTPTDGALSITQGTTGIRFNAELVNAGEGDAYNVSFVYDLPPSWIVTFGSGVMNLDDDFYSEDSVENYVELIVPVNAPVGDYVISVSGEAVNSSGADLVEAGLVFTDYVTVSVLPSQTFSSGGGGGGETTTPIVDSSSSSSGGGSGQKVVSGDSETIYTTEKFSIIRGTTESLPITITNLYENTYFQDLNLEMRGFLTQYVEIDYVYDSEKPVFVESKSVRLSFAGVKVPFNLTEIGSHFISLSALRNDSADFTIYSDPVNVSLNLGESKNVDLDGDGAEESAITLWSIEGGVAQVFLHKLGVGREDRLYFLESRNYTLEVFAPPYLEKRDYEVTLDINFSLVATDSVAAGFSSKQFLEQRTLIFSLIEKSNDEAVAGLEEARLSLLEMREAGFPVESIEDLLKKAEDAFDEVNYEETLEFVAKILELNKFAFEADALIAEIAGVVDEAKARWLEVEETESSLVLAIKAFEREDFEAAVSRAKDAQLALILETKGKFDVIWVLVNYWWAIIICSMFLLFLLFMSYKHSYIFVVNQRLKSLTKEELSINVLMEEAQTLYLTKGSLSPDGYKLAIAKYEKRLNDLKHLRVSLRNKRVGILRTDQELKNLKKEQAELGVLMKQTQVDYFKKEKLTERKFKSLYNLEKERVAELDEEKIVLEEKQLKEIGTRKYKLLKFLSNVGIKMKSFFVGKVKKK